MDEHRGDAGAILQPDEHPTFVDTWKEMEKLVGTGELDFDVDTFRLRVQS